MNRVFNKSFAPLNLDAGILIIRIAISVLMLTHGVPKLLTFFTGEPIAFASVLGMGPGVSLALAVFSEVICSVLLIFGLATRPALAMLIITMAAAGFYIHADDPLAVKEKAFVFLLTYILLFFTGSGKYSLDKMLSKKRYF